MKVVLDASPLAQTEKTGVAYFIYFFARALLETARDDHIVIWAPDMANDPLPEFSDKEFRGRGLFSRGALETLWSRFSVGALKEDADIYHLPYVALAAPMRSARTRMVVTVYDLAFAHYPETVSDLGYFRYLAERLPEQVAQADGIIAISQSTKRDLEQILGVPPEKIIVSYPATELRAPEEGAVPSLEETKLLQSLPKRYILCLGTWEPRKNLSCLFRAMGILRRKLEEDDVYLCIAGGKGWKYDEAESLLVSLGLEDRVRRLGYVPRPWLPRLYAGAQMFVYPSLYEGFGMPVLEAMACGTPVITSNVSSLPEAAGDAGLLVNPHEVDELAGAIERLLDDEALRENLKGIGFRHAQKFSWHKAAREALALYEGLVKAP